MIDYGSISRINYIIIFVFVLLLILFIYIVYRNKKKYEGKPREVPSAKELEAKKVQKKPEQKLENKRLKPELIPGHEPKVTEKINLPECNYPKFDHSRLLKMGLSQEEAKEFVLELIPQIEAQIPLIKEAMKISDFHNMEQLTHSIKGSSTTVGTGGISDLLCDYNTYLKTGKELAIVEAYFKQLNHYYKELKKQYSE